MKVMNGYERWKSIGLLTLLIWLLSFQTYHVLSEHSEQLFGHDHHVCEHHHDTDQSQTETPSSEDDDCQICKLVSLPFVTTASFEISFATIEFSSENSEVYLSSSNQRVLYSRGQRGPPVV